MRTISTPEAPRPAGHYSQAMVHQGLVFTAGQLPIDPADPEKPIGDATAQTEQALRNVAAVLQAAGSSLQQVLQMTIYVSDMELWPEVNQTCARMFGEHRPARAVVPTSEFRKGYQIEIQVIAATT
ncbi:MAG: RidA family protein [Gemmatimonadetes bacterium]|nr:RidA family protein [Gemmatimonadota bacterium]